MRRKRIPLQADFSALMRRFIPSPNPIHGEQVQAQNNRAGMDYADFDGIQNAAASLDGFN